MNEVKIVWVDPERKFRITEEHDKEMGVYNYRLVRKTSAAGVYKLVGGCLGVDAKDDAREQAVATLAIEAEGYTD